MKKEYSELSELQTQLNDQKDEVQKVLDATNVQLADLEKQIGENAANLNKLSRSPGKPQNVRNRQQRRPQPARKTMVHMSHRDRP